MNPLDVLEKQSPVFELSLNKQKKPPHKLKPLVRENTGGTANMALSVLEIENAYQKEILNDIDSDIREYLDAGKIFSEMKSAFNSQETGSEIALQANIKHKGTKKQKSELDPILEESA